jgi:transcriptional regulator with XRE-family HTH domain
MSSFGERVRKIRTEQGLTAKELSSRSKVPEKTIYRIETGEVSDPKLSTIEPIVRALTCSADELLFNAESFTKLEQLRQLFLKFTEMNEVQQDFLLEVISRVNMSFAFEGIVTDSRNKASSDAKGKKD